MVRDGRIKRSVMPPMFIRFAVSRKNGTASRMKELYALNVSWTIVTVMKARLDQKDRQRGERQRERDQDAQEQQEEEGRTGSPRLAEDSTAPLMRPS